MGMVEKRTLWFEGAGMFETGEPVGNCRLRTAFTNDDGISYYLEILGTPHDEKWLKVYGLDDEFSPGECVGWADFAFRITADPGIDDCNESRHELVERHMHFRWTIPAILDLVNRWFGCSFDEARVAPEFSGYHVHAGRRTGTSLDYNFGDEFELDEESTAKLEMLHDREAERQRERGVRYPCVSVYRDDEDAELVHVCHHKKGGLDSFDIRVRDIA